MNFRLEYNQIQGMFHCDDGRSEKNSFGWATICDSLSYAYCDEFIEKIHGRYTFFDDAISHPRLETIKRDFGNFLKDKIKAQV